MAYWKVRLNGISSALGDVEMRTCETADTMDQAIALVRLGAGAAFQRGSAAAQALSDLEQSDIMRAERIFVDSGDFNAYLREMA